MKETRPRAKRFSRRDFLKVSGTGLAGAALLGTAGCGGGGEQGEGPIELVFTASPDTTGTAPKLVEKFNEQNKGKYKVIFQPGNADSDARFDKLRAEMQAGGKNIDIILGDIIWTAQLAANGWISDLSNRFTEEMRADFLPGSVEAIIYEGKPYGVPWFTDTGLLYYRKDLLEQSGFSGPPKTWDELKEMALKAKRDSGTKFGFVFQGDNYEGGVCNGSEFIWTHGGEILDPQDPTRVLVGQPEAVAGLTAYRSMVEDGVAPESVSIYDENDTDGAFLRGDAIFERCWPYVYALTSDPKASEIKQDQVGVSEIPSADGKPGNGTVGDQPLYINATSPYQDEAWEFIKFATAPEQETFRAAEGSYLPTLTNLYNDPEVQKNVPIVPLAEEALQHTKPRPVSPYYSDMSLEMAEQFNAALKGEVSPEEAAQTLQKQLESIIEQSQES
jgi:multiple sugar transport system substrate-binding protein